MQFEIQREYSKFLSDDEMGESTSEGEESETPAVPGGSA